MTLGLFRNLGDLLVELLPASTVQMYDWNCHPTPVLDLLNLWLVDLLIFFV